MINLSSSTETVRINLRILQYSTYAYMHEFELHARECIVIDVHVAHDIDRCELDNFCKVVCSCMHDVVTVANVFRDNLILLLKPARFLLLLESACGCEEVIRVIRHLLRLVAQFLSARKIVRRQSLILSHRLFRSRDRPTGGIQLC